ncbi:MAG: glycosyltransferase family 4 protein [Bacteroidales bacterium]|jgi:glycosyltransferase involved in cell wall biosynthesis|nr:glycosyltransferase family 4 protein [Bacteroidales bacterium]
MNIAINTRLLIQNKLEGIGWFTYESLKRITIQHPEHHFFFIFDREYDPEFLFSDNITPIIQFPQARHPVLYYAWFELTIPKLLEKLKPDLFLSPDGFLSLKTPVKSMAVFHDLNFEHYPQDIPFWTRRYYRQYFPKYAAKAVRIATVSEFSKNDIVQQYKVTPDKIDVVYDGAHDIYHPLPEDEREKVRKIYTQGLPYFIFIGSLHRRKNLINLFRAFDLFKKSNPSDVKLIIVGAKKWWTRDIDIAYNRMVFSDDVIFTGRLSVEELSRVLGAAIALTYVSYFEGFGIPIVEAFRSDVPVITSNVTSMPEIAGDAALFVDPFNPESIAEALYKAYQYESIREELIVRGRRRKDLFSWQQTADRLWESIEKAVKS